VLGSLYLLRLVRRRVPGRLRSFLRDVPVLATACGLAITVAVEFLARPLCPEGGLGLLTCGVLALPGLAVFGIVALGWSRSVSLAGIALARFRGGRRTVVPVDGAALPHAEGDADVLPPGDAHAAGPLDPLP
jgi:hypothetical protein